MTTNEAAIRASEVEKAVWAATKNFKGILNELQRRQIALDVVAHLSASVPQVTRVPVCMCGLDENPRLPRLDILCPKHDGQFPASVPEQRIALSGECDNEAHSICPYPDRCKCLCHTPAQSPRVCVKCGRSEFASDTPRTHECEFPASPSITDQ